MGGEENAGASEKKNAMNKAARWLASLQAGREGWIRKAVLALVYGRKGWGLSKSGDSELTARQQVRYVNIPCRDLHGAGKTRRPLPWAAKAQLPGLLLMPSL